MKRGLTLLAAFAALALPGAASSDLNQGPQTILAILVTWGPQPFTPAALHDSLFDEANTYVQHASFGEASLVGDVTPWLPVKQFVDCEPDTISDMELAALNAAKAAGFDPTNYSRHVFAFPRPGPCNFLGFGAGSEVWLFGTDSANVIQHELGHTFGFGHAWSVSTCPTCRPVEYGDPYDEMGHGVGQYNAFEKAAAGWLTNVTTARTKGDYVIDQLEQKSTLSQALVVHTAVNDYWFDHREPLLEDAVFAASPIVQGVEVHASPSPDDRNGDSPYQPGDVLISNPARAGADAVRPGETFSEQGAFSLTVLDHVGTHIDVRFRWTDTKPPGKPAIYSPLGIVRSKLDVEWGRAAETGSGLARYLVLLDGKRRASLLSDASRQLLLPKPRRGTHVVAIVAVDRAGNRSRPGVSTFTVR